MRIVPTEANLFEPEDLQEIQMLAQQTHPDLIAEAQGRLQTHLRHHLEASIVPEYGRPSLRSPQARRALVVGAGAVALTAESGDTAFVISAAVAGAGYWFIRRACQVRCRLLAAERASVIFGYIYSMHGEQDEPSAEDEIPASD